MVLTNWPVYQIKRDLIAGNFTDYTAVDDDTAPQRFEQEIRLNFCLSKMLIQIAEVFTFVLTQERHHQH